MTPDEMQARNQRRDDHLDALRQFMPQLPGPFVYTDEEVRRLRHRLQVLATYEGVWFMPEFWLDEAARYGQCMERGGDSEGTAEDYWEARLWALDRAERLEADGPVGMYGGEYV